LRKRYRFFFVGPLFPALRSRHRQRVITLHVARLGHALLHFDLWLAVSLLPGLAFSDYRTYFSLVLISSSVHEQVIVQATGLVLELPDSKARVFLVLAMLSWWLLVTQMRCLMKCA
jgi:hypothetical protein